MDNKKIDKVIDAFRNYIQLKEMMSANVSGSSGGFSSSSDAKGPTAGFDPVMGMRRRKGPQIKLPPGQRKRWKTNQQ